MDVKPYQARKTGSSCKINMYLYEFSVHMYSKYMKPGMSKGVQKAGKHRLGLITQLFTQLGSLKRRVGRQGMQYIVFIYIYIYISF